MRRNSGGDVMYVRPNHVSFWNLMHMLLCALMCTQSCYINPWNEIFRGLTMGLVWIRMDLLKHHVIWVLSSVWDCYPSFMFPDKQQRQSNHHWCSFHWIQENTFSLLIWFFFMHLKFLQMKISTAAFACRMQMLNSDHEPSNHCICFSGCLLLMG